VPNLRIRLLTPECVARAGAQADGVLTKTGHLAASCMSESLHPHVLEL
jgi:hypothetical protein